MAEQKLLFKRGTKAVLEAKLVGDNKPLKGEPIYETDTGKFKIGDGVNNYADLPYVSGADYSAGDGITIADKTISVNNTIARQSALDAEAQIRAAADTNLDDRLKAVEGRGRFLSNWDAATGKPTSYPTPTSYPFTYTFKSGDYYLVSNVPASGIKYAPSGTSISKASETAEWVVGKIETTESLAVGGQYTFDSTSWTYTGAAQSVSWGRIEGTLSDQEDLQAALDAKQNLIDASNKLNADLVDDAASANKFVTALEKQDIATISSKASQSALESEITRATQAEQSLQSDISTLQTSLANEIERAQSAEGILSTAIETVGQNLDLEKQRAELAESNLQSAIATEKTRAEGIEAGLRTDVNAKSTVSVSASGSSTSEVQYITVDGTEYKLAGGGSSSPITVTQKECAAGADHATILAQIENPKKGDIAVIKEAIDGSTAEATKWQYTAYVRDTSSWVAMDGNYNAENVYFAKDLIYTKQIGELPDVPSTGSATLAAKGKNVKQIFDAILAQRKQPNIDKNPSVSFTAGVQSNEEAELGTTISKSGTLQSLFDPGKYTYGPPTGIIPTEFLNEINWIQGKSGLIARDTGSGSIYGPSVTYSYSGILGTDGDVLKVSFFAKATHGQGVIAKDNLGDDSNPEKRIEGGNASKTAIATYTGYRKMFYGTRADKTDLDSSKIRALVSSEKELAKTISVSIPIGAYRTIIAVPASRTVTSVKDVNGMGAEILSSFSQENIAVEGANGYTAISYKVYYIDYAEAISKENKYTVTIA